MLGTAGHLQLVLMTEGILAHYAVIPVLVPYALGIGANLAGSGINDIFPFVVLERVVHLTTQFRAKRCTGTSLGFFPIHTLIELDVTQSLVEKLYKLLLVNESIALGGTR